MEIVCASTLNIEKVKCGDQVKIIASHKWVIFHFKYQISLLL